MHLSQWVSKTNAGCFLEGFGGVQTDVPSLCIILQSQCLSLPREVPFVPGELCPCQKKPRIRLCLPHPLPPRGTGALQALGGAGTGRAFLTFPQLETVPSLRKSPCTSVRDGGGGCPGSSFPRSCLWRGSACPGPGFCQWLPSWGRCQTFLIFARRLLAFGSYIPLGAPLGSRLFILK